MSISSMLRGRWALLESSLKQNDRARLHESIARTAFYFFTFAYGVMTIVKLTRNAGRIPINWTWSELLINYQGGFVKRGLLGEIFFQIQPYIGAVAVATVLVFCAYCLFTFLALQCLTNVPLSAFLFFVLSPAAFAFPIYDPRVFGRKEIFFFCAFALTLLTYIEFSDYRAKIVSFLFLYTVVALIHEAALFFAPLSACLLVLSMEGHSQRFRIAVLFSLLLYVLGLGCFLLLSVNPNYDVSAIVRSWKPFFPNIEMAGGMKYLNKGFDLFLTQTRNKFLNFNGFTKPYLRDFCWALLPSVLLFTRGNYAEFAKNLLKSQPLVFLSLIGSLLAPVGLFLFQDWGRWIHFIAVHTFISLAALNRFGLVAYKPIPRPTNYHLKVYAFFFAYYALLWRMPHLR